MVKPFAFKCSFKLLLGGPNLISSFKLLFSPLSCSTVSFWSYFCYLSSTLLRAFPKGDTLSASS